MKEALRRRLGLVLERAGFTDASRVVKLKEELARASEHSRQFKAAAEKARGEAAAIRARLEQIEKRATDRRTEEEDRFRARVHKLELGASRAAEQAKKRDEERARKLDELKERFEATVRLNTLAREQLMAVEVKLDIVEGAIAVLDNRTRGSSSKHDRRL